MNDNDITPGVASPKTILIVDDTPENLRVLLELLKQQGYKDLILERDRWQHFLVPNSTINAPVSKSNN